MKKLWSLFLAAALLFAAGSAFAQEEDTREHILIAYFTWAENTIVADADASLQSALEHYENMGDAASGVDATSSASLLAPGNTAVMAEHIQRLVGGDLFSIRVAEPYPSNYDDCLDRAADELDDDARPKLQTQVENMAQYDYIFLGMPNWWYSCPRAILSFIEAYDLSGKTIIPFVAHGTGGISGSVRDMSRSLPSDCTVLEPIGIYRPDIPTCQPTLEEWLRGFELPFAVGATGADDGARGIRLTVGETVLYAALEDNSAAQSLYDMLPMTLTFEDFNGIEKIAYPAEKLDVSGAPQSSDPGVGTLAFYEPWGNLSIFYQDFRVSEGLVPLGSIEGDMTVFAEQTEPFVVTLERGNE